MRTKTVPHGWMFALGYKFRVLNREDQEDEASGVSVVQTDRVYIDYTGMNGRNVRSFEMPVDSQLLRALAQKLNIIAAKNDPSE